MNVATAFTKSIEIAWKIRVVLPGLLMRCVALPSLDQPDTDYDTVCEDIRRFPSLVSLVLRFADKFSLDGLCPSNLGAPNLSGAMGGS